LFMSGEHELIGSWPLVPTPGNQFYSWLVRTDLMGNGSCSMSTGISTATTSYTVTPSTFMQSNSLITSPLTIFVRQINQLLLNECTNPFRLAAEKENAISVFPNPASTQLTINNTSESVLVFEITNLLGELIQSKTIPATSGELMMDISNISPGVYLYRLTDGEHEVKSDKLVITQ
ncbi:MAG: T9SS type A sorting domain-containing protein, partial [Bacteroidia bacterium]